MPNSRITEGANKSACFRAFIIGAYDLPTLSFNPSGMPGSSPAASNQKASLPLVTCTISKTTVSTPSPKSKHPTNRSFRYDSAILFPNRCLSEVFSESAVFTVIQSGQELATVTVPISTLPIRSKSAASKEKEIIYTLTPSKNALAPSPEVSATATPPTLRLTITLTGELRSEVSTLSAAATSYFAAVDSACDAVTPYASKVKSALSTKYAIIPALPVVVGIACLTPVVAGVCIIGLPLFLPLFVVMIFISTFTAAGAFGLYLSTPSGRRRVSAVAGPTVDKLLSSSVGKQFLYSTGPRPSPVSLAEATIPMDMAGKLATSLLLDFIGSCSYLIPGAGEAFDVFWAPFQTICIQAMYDKGNPYIKYVSFAEEIIPFTDALPTASLGWLREFGPAIVLDLKERVEKGAIVVRRGGKEAEATKAA
ncbi:hypothetical protein TeGR_g7158 [Tetraparma gracilis]|uniref:Uncharacterized protein n=1 Tax=Tetraparma gracilis TaxID=2962635 RepID=A0ABQ6NB19_9STRA|nr:hypothetical protein TeGR_g7158 [Tetraparma gracilis]